MGELSSDKVYGLSFKLRPEYGSGVLCLRNLDDPSKYDSTEFAAQGVDELTKNPFETFMKLRTCLRWPGIPNTKFIAGSNPGSRGHVWVKKYFVERKDYPPEEAEVGRFGYLQMLPTDNPYLSAEYRKQLESITDPKLRKALLFGDWNIFEGQYFSEWEHDIHVIKPFPIPSSWPRRLMLDYGWTAPSAVYWRAMNVDRQRFYYRELYRTGLTPRDLASMIVDMTPKDELDLIDGIYLDPDCMRSRAGEDDLARQMAEPAEPGKEVQLYLRGTRIPIRRAINNRVARAMKMRELLKVYTGPFGKTSKIQIVATACPNLVRTLPELGYSTDNPDDVDTDQEDHAYDSICYGEDGLDKPDINYREMSKTNASAPKLVSTGANW